MNLTGRLSIRSKLVILLLLSSIISILIVAYQGYKSAQGALNQSINNQLTTLREVKTQQVESYFSNIHNQVLAFSENRGIIEALNEFRTAYRLTEQEALNDAEKEKLAAYYRSEFIPRLRDKTGGEPVAKHYIPDTGATAYLQHHYMTSNPNDIGSKDILVKAQDDETFYAQVHERYHETLRSLIKQFGYYDLFLIDPETGNVVYTVFKETDFATNLLSGPYATSSFAELTKSMMRTKERGQVKFQDYDSYAPSYGAPAAFVAVTVYDGKNLAGILALQISSDQLNNVMTSNHRWEESGMGKTGEVYLVGRDHLMRSESRFLIQEKDTYLSMLKNIGMSKNEINRIVKSNTTILFQPIHAETVDLALSGKTGTKAIIDYRGIPVISAYAPLRVHGLDWVVQSDMDVAEINVPINQFRRQVMVSASILGVAITLLALLAASIFTKPINALVKGLRRVGTGETDVKVVNTSNDELGELTKSFNTMVDGIQAQQELITEKDHENEMLLLNILPEPIAQRMKAGEENIVDRVPNVSIIYTTLTGLTKPGQDTPEEAIRKLNHLVQEFDEAAERNGVDKLKTVGDDYMAVCGLMTPRLDHYKRAIEFSLEMREIVERISREFDLTLHIKIGIHSGSVLAGVIGRDRFTYDVWGTTVDIVNEVRDSCSPDSICVSESVYEQVKDKYDFISSSTLDIDTAGSVKTWELTIKNDVELIHV